MVITLFENTKVKYICHRDSCSNSAGSFFLNGAHASKSYEHQEETPAVRDTLWRRPKRRTFNGVTFPLTTFEKEWIKKVWGIEHPPHWFHTPQFGERIAMSVRSPQYTHRGWVLRDISGHLTSKALTYVEDGHPPLSWYRRAAFKGTILVEDIPSAVRASKHITAVALLGTGCGEDRALEIAQYAPRPIMIALDQDATSTAFAIRDRWGLMWEDVRIIPLKRDLKDMQEDELEALIDLNLDKNNNERAEHTRECNS